MSFESAVTKLFGEFLKVYNYGGICGFQLRVLIGTRFYATPNAFFAFQRHVRPFLRENGGGELSPQIFQ